MTLKASIIGGGPAGLMAAEVLAERGIAVDLYDAMPSAGRKFLLAGLGGLNITHAEPLESFLQRYGSRQIEMAPFLRAFDGKALRQWCHELGIETFVGSSQRVFPTHMKAAPLLRAWLKRLRQQGVRFHPRHRWQGWDENGKWLFETPEGLCQIKTDVTVLALGGGSWSRLGSDGRWLPLLQEQGIDIAELEPSNCGFEVTAWSPLLQQSFIGAPVKPVGISLNGLPPRQGEFVISRYGVEGSLIYALSAPIRQAIRRQGYALLSIDLLPHLSLEQVETALSKPKGSRTLTRHLRNCVNLQGVRTALLYELSDKPIPADPARLAALLKNLPLRLVRTRPLEEAISSAGGVRFEAVNSHLMLLNRPGVFCAGEMLDWEAPTGGYLLTGCFATGRAAGMGAWQWLQRIHADR